MIYNVHIPLDRNLRQFVNMRCCIYFSLKCRLAHSAPIAGVVIAQFPRRGSSQNQFITIRTDKLNVLATADFPVNIVFQLFAPTLWVVPKNDLPVGADIFFAIGSLFNARHAICSAWRRARVFLRNGFTLHLDMCKKISIHAPREGRDIYAFSLGSAAWQFQSTRPVRGATPDRLSACRHLPISIHAPRAGRDSRRVSSVSSDWMFQSTRPVRGATALVFTLVGQLFVSIHAPRAGRDVEICGVDIHLAVSIHAPRAGRDRAAEALCMCELYFNPRAPCGARQHHAIQRNRRRKDFNPRAPCGARPVAGAVAGVYWQISIHAPHAGRDKEYRWNHCHAQIFQSTRPMRGATKNAGKNQAKKN